jgi:beta-galactosidase/beta-glucuronidase
MPATVDHPRPFLQRAWQSLDGPWQFAFDRDRRHVTADDVDFARTIHVPFAPETPAAGVGPDGRGADGHVQRCWYRRTVEVAPPVGGERVIVHFGGVDRIADVWSNGAHVGHHEGGYTPFAVDVTAAAGSGTVELVVCADDDGHDLEVPRGKQDWLEHPHSIFYPRTTGIWKTVWLERVPAIRIEAISWSNDVDAMTITMRVDATVEPGSEPPEGLRLDVRLGVGDDVLVDDTITVLGAGSRRSVERTFTVGTGSFEDRFLRTWWPSRPTIIDATLGLCTTDGRALDTVESYTALRSVEVSDGQLRINGRPYPLRLVLDQGYWPDTGATPPDVDALRRDIELTKALGFNGARKHQKTEDPRYFALADRLGLLTWVEMPSAYRPGTRASANLLREWTDIVETHRNHPSVIAWVPVNESWGVTGCESDHRQRALIGALRDSTNALDGTRPVSANDGWETSGGDIVGVHDYDRDPAALTTRWGDRRAVDDVIAGRRPDGRLVDLDRRPSGDRAVVLSEFGGIAMAADADGGFSLGNENWGYDLATSADDLLRRYRALWAAVHASSALAGGCWTQLTDTYQEVNGLLTATREPKADLAALAAATRGRPSG